MLRYGQALLLIGDYKRAQKAYGWGLNKLPMENPRRKVSVLQQE